MKAALACPSSPDVPPGIARPVQQIPAREQNQLICARRKASPRSQPAANIRHTGDRRLPSPSGRITR
jgi:hypothetical protein